MIKHSATRLRRATRFRLGSLSSGLSTQSPRHWSKLTSSQCNVLGLPNRSTTETMPHPYRYWLALHPDIRRPIGGVKQVHRLAEALTHLGREARIIQDNAEFHPGWFKSTVLTVSYSEFRSSIQLRPDRDIIILPETYLPVLPNVLQGFRNLSLIKMVLTVLVLSLVMVFLTPMKSSNYMLILN